MPLDIGGADVGPAEAHLGQIVSKNMEGNGDDQSDELEGVQSRAMHQSPCIFCKLSCWPCISFGLKQLLCELMVVMALGLVKPVSSSAQRQVAQRTMTVTDLGEWGMPPTAAT